MKTVLTTFAFSMLMAGPALAQKANEHDGHHPAPGVTAQAAASGDMTEGEVRKVDKANAKITLKHGEIRNLDMPPMTMVFSVKDKALLDKLKVGDKVRFKAVNESGTFTVAELQTAP